MLNKSDQTRAFGTSWEANDEIGVFVKTSGVSLSETSVINGYANVAYQTSGSGVFTAAAQAIDYPKDNSPVDVIAYYPYKNTLNGYMYEVDVTDQSVSKNIDLMWSNNITGTSAANPQTGMRFTHQLSKINFNIKAGVNVQNLQGLTVSVAAFPTQAKFNLGDGTFTVDNTSVKNIAFKTTTGSGATLAEALVIPEGARAGRVVAFTLPSGESFTWEIPSATKLESGGQYTWAITLEGKVASAVQANGYVETPEMTNIPPDATYIKHMMPTGNTKMRNYAMLYDKKYKMAYWVAYPLHDCYLGSSGRTDAWAYSPGVGQSDQPYLKKGFGGTYDRGHQLPSADRLCDNATNATTFYYTNMTAQVSNFNQGTWNSLEQKMRESWMKQCDTLYVVTGAMPTTATDVVVKYVDDNNGQPVAVPKYHFKALAKRTGNTYHTVAFKMDNSSSTTGNYNNYRLSVSDLEKLTGFTFFPQISADIKSKITANQWN